jgi:SAM-dependent methyltransferase
MSAPDDRYLTDDYVTQNPSWDLEDSPWKASLVKRILDQNGTSPSSICEVGCGAAYVLAELAKMFPQAELFGYDIAPAAARFWPQHESVGIHLTVGDFLTLNRRTYDVILLLDVIEHVRDPSTFLVGLREMARLHVLHIPLDLSALTVLREKPLLSARRKVGHIHSFTKNLALAMIQESGFRIIHWEYTRAAFVAPRPTWKSRAAMLPRWLAQRLNKDFGVRALGGETLMVLAEAADQLSPALQTTL